MAGDVEAEQFLFVREQFVLRPFGHCLSRLRFCVARSDQHPKKRVLAALPVVEDAGGARQDVVDLGEHRGAGFAKAIARARI